MQNDTTNDARYSCPAVATMQEACQKYDLQELLADAAQDEVHEHGACGLFVQSDAGISAPKERREAPPPQFGRQDQERLAAEWHRHLFTDSLMNGWGRIGWGGCGQA